MESTQKKILRVNNFVLSQGRWVVAFIFQDFFIEIEINQKTRQFDIILHKTLKIKEGDKIREEKIEDYVDIDRFKRHFGVLWNLVYDRYEQG